MGKKWIISIAVLVLAVVSAGTANAASSHGGKHWTERQAERNLVVKGLSDRNGNRSWPYTADCRGFGHSFVAWNGNRVYNKFYCVTTWDDGTYTYEIQVRGGWNAVWYLV